MVGKTPKTFNKEEHLINLYQHVIGRAGNRTTDPTTGARLLSTLVVSNLTNFPQTEEAI